MAPGRRKGANLIDSKKPLSLGDLVLAKVKGFPPWPAKVRSFLRFYSDSWIVLIIGFFESCKTRVFSRPEREIVGKFISFFFFFFLIDCVSSTVGQAFYICVGFMRMLLDDQMLDLDLTRLLIYFLKEIVGFVCADQQA